MTRSVLIVVLALAGGCGDLSNDDLVFLAGVPRAEEVAVGIAADGTTPNALTGLVGDPAEYYDLAAGVAGTFDAVVGMSIGFVDQLGWGYPPTHRTENTRVWGPVHDVDGSGITIRLEIRRDTLEDGAPMFTYCLHAGPDELSGGEPPTCESPATNGLRLLMWGSYVPQPGTDSGRSGRGEINIDFETIHALDPTEDARGLLTVEYDFTGSGAARTLHIEWVRIVSLTGLSTERAEYDFDATSDGHMAFSFVFEGDAWADSGPVGSSAKESLAVEACWSEDGPGRADVIVTGGDLDFGQAAHGRECWDPLHDRTYWSLEVDDTTYEEEGDIALCPAACGG